MADFYTPSSRFSRKLENPPEKMNFYAPPKSREFANSGVSNVGADSEGMFPQPSQYVKPAPEAKRPGSNPPPGIESYAAPIMEGLNNSSTPATTDVASNIISVGGNTLAGAATGALSGAAIGAAGGPIGALGGAAIGGSVALLTSGLNAWLGHRQAKSEKDRIAAIQADANRIKQEEIARDEKWRVQNRLDSLETARYERKKYAEQVARQNMTETATKLQAALANNASLRDHWAKYGFN